jgi:hypothetical protein
MADDGAVFLPHRLERVGSHPSAQRSKAGRLRDRMLDAVHVERQGRGLLFAGHVHASLRQLHDVIVDFDAQRRALELMVGVEVAIVQWIPGKCFTFRSR